MAPLYKLRYFNVKALAEPIRLVFAFAGVEYEDIRHSREDPNWLEIKEGLPWGTMPVLEEGDKILCQSIAILRYVGKKFGLAGDDEFEAAKCDEIIDAMVDLQIATSPYWKEKDEDKKKEVKTKLLTESFPKFLIKLNENLETNGSGFLVGSRFSYADAYVACFFELFQTMFEAKWFEEYPAVGAHQKAVLEAPGIKEWVAKRPVTQW